METDFKSSKENNQQVNSKKDKFLKHEDLPTLLGKPIVNTMKLPKKLTGSKYPIL